MRASLRFVIPLACVTIRVMNGDEKGTKKPSHKVLKVVLAVVSVLVLLGIIGNLASPSSSNTKSGGTSPAASSSSSNSGAAEAPKVPGLNQPADDGKFRFVATAFTCGKSNWYENRVAVSSSWRGSGL